ncbi:MAG: periplasmic heavy metal sensor [bacterium]
MKKRFIIFGISLLFIINLSAVSTIGYHRWCRYRSECTYRESLTGETAFYEQLSLSEKQIETINPIRHAFLARADRMNSSLCEKRTELLDCLKSAEPDSQKINAVLGQIDSMQADLQKNVIHCLLKEKQILTTEQQQRLFSIIKERMLKCTTHQQTSEFNPFIEDQCENECPKDEKPLKIEDERR